jgi:hypothetical protein
MAVLDHLAAYRLTRPARGLVLVPLVDGIPWQATMTSALRGQAATWGGAANLPVPWTEDLVERPEFWALVEALDPDAVLLPTLSRSDLHGIVHGVEARPAGGVVSQDDMPLGRPDARSVLEALAGRLPILQRNGMGRPHNVAPEKGAGFPFIGIATIEELPAVAGVRFPADPDLGLLLAAERGDLHDAQIANLAQRGVVAETYVLDDDEDALAKIFDGPSPTADPGPWALAEAGLRWLVPGARGEAVVSIVVGDDPWDFATAYALRRHTGLAWWLPSRLARDSAIVARLARRIGMLNHEAESGLVLSSSDTAAATRLATALQADPDRDGLSWAVDADVTAALRQPANRLLTDASGLESLAISDGKTGYLPPRLPAVRARSGGGLYWMSEVAGVNWQPLPDARLAAAVVHAPGYGTAQARPTRDGVAYLCPHFIRRGDEDLEAATIRPRIATLGLREQLATIAADDGWTLAPSDKGLYAEACAATLGGDGGLLDAVTDPGWAAVLSGLRHAGAPDGSPRGWDLKDGRVYFTIQEVEAVRAEASAMAPEVGELLRRGVLLRGLVFRCPLCALKGWYGADELAERLRCSRCRRPFTLTEPGWQPEPEPQWRYRLAEVFWQMLQHNGDLPLRALRNVLGIGGDWQSGPTAFLHEHDLWAPTAERPIELDICAQRGPELWIGEAKIAGSLGAGAQATAKLDGLRRSAELLRPHGVVLVTAKPAWSQDTERKAHDALGKLGCEILLASSPPVV